MSKGQEVEDVPIDARTLVVALDETGQEEFKNVDLFGLSGVAGFGIQLMRAERRWRHMKRDHFGGEGQVLHGSGRKMTQAQLDAIGRFFATSHLPRFAFLMAKPDNMPAEYNALHALRGFLIEQLVRFVGDRDVLPDNIVIVVERSQRLEPKLKEVFPGLKLEVDGKEIPILAVLEEKGSGWAPLEMADQVSHRAQRQFRFSGQERPEWFEAVFPRGAPYACYFQLVPKIEIKGV